ncbi:MAG: hypothetical protein WC319_14775 [Candidatus Paceibacterota bacterium]|jgi:hypothetical protein
MKSSELIETLQNLNESYGDLSIFLEHECNDQIHVTILPDIGFILSKTGAP